MSRILIVDDEPLARRRLELVLLELGLPAEDLGQADGVDSALAAIAQDRPDILLLDVRMRDGTGFDLLERLPRGFAPAVVFVTAYDDFAVQAFEIEAIDYLVKPVSLDRLRLALGRARKSLETRSAEVRRRLLDRAAAGAPAQHGAPDGERESEFWIRRAGGDFVRLDVASIEYAVVEEDYVRIFAAGRSYLLRESIRGLRARLDPDEFLQIHRSTIIRASEMKEVARGRFGQAEVLLRGGQRLPLGRIYGKAVQRLIRRQPPLAKSSYVRDAAASWSNGAS